MQPSVTVDDVEKGLRLLLFRQFLDEASASRWWRVICENVPWFRVKYRSARFGKECETPCWTAFYGGFKEVEPYVPIPAWLQPLVEQVLNYHAYVNSVVSHFGSSRGTYPYPFTPCARRLSVE